MSIPVYTFFNNKGGVGKTTLLYNLAWMYRELGLQVLMADLDPQANLTAAFLSEERLYEIFPDAGNPAPQTIYEAVKPLVDGTGDIVIPAVQTHPTVEALALVAGDLRLSQFEDSLSETWPKCLSGDARALRITSAFWRVIQGAAEDHHADLILVDVGPNLGAINRAALIATDYVITPLAPDLFSVMGLRNLGPRLASWRKEWQKRLDENTPPPFPLPSGKMQPIGYVVLQYIKRLDRPVKAYEHWIKQIPHVYREAVLNQPTGETITVEQDTYALSLLKHYASLMPMAQEARKPVFLLKPADGAIGSHLYAVQQSYREFASLARQIADKSTLALAEPLNIEEHP